MDYEDYIELYEAVYFVNRIINSIGNKSNKLSYSEKIRKLGITESVYNAVMRILVVNDFIDYDGTDFILTDEHEERQKYIFDSLINKSQEQRYIDMFNKAIIENHFFFDSISEIEYEIYSRCNFPVTFKIGEELSKHINLDNKKVLELGGNSGGLASALLTANERLRRGTKTRGQGERQVRKENRVRGRKWGAGDRQVGR